MTFVLVVFLSTGVLNLASYPTADQCDSAAKIVQDQLYYGPGGAARIACVKIPTPLP